MQFGTTHRCRSWGAPRTDARVVELAAHDVDVVGAQRPRIEARIAALLAEKQMETRRLTKACDYWQRSLGQLAFARWKTLKQLEDSENHLLKFFAKNTSLRKRHVWWAWLAQARGSKYAVMKEKCETVCQQVRATDRRRRRAARAILLCSHRAILSGSQVCQTVCVTEHQSVHQDFDEMNNWVRALRRNSAELCAML